MIIAGLWIIAATVWALNGLMLLWLRRQRRRLAEARAVAEAAQAARHAELLAMVFCDPEVEAALARAGDQRAVLEAAIRIEVAWIAYATREQLEASLEAP